MYQIREDPTNRFSWEYVVLLGLRYPLYILYEATVHYYYYSVRDADLFLLLWEVFENEYNWMNEFQLQVEEFLKFWASYLMRLPSIAIVIAKNYQNTELLLLQQLIEKL